MPGNCCRLVDEMMELIAGETSGGGERKVGSSCVYFFVSLFFFCFFLSITGEMRSLIKTLAIFINFQSIVQARRKYRFPY